MIRKTEMRTKRGEKAVRAAGRWSDEEIGQWNRVGAARFRGGGPMSEPTEQTSGGRRLEWNRKPGSPGFRAMHEPIGLSRVSGKGDGFREWERRSRNRSSSPEESTKEREPFA